MSKIISVVPNISEGNDQAFISGLVEKLQAVKNLVVLDTSRDSVRNRTVFSFTGPQEAIFAGGLILYRETLAHVDMRQHHGEYPRLGAVDVFPFVPLKDAIPGRDRGHVGGIRRKSGRGIQYPGLSLLRIGPLSHAPLCREHPRGRVRGAGEQAEGPALETRFRARRLQSRRRAPPSSAPAIP